MGSLRVTVSGDNYLILTCVLAIRKTIKVFFITDLETLKIKHRENTLVA